MRQRELLRTRSSRTPAAMVVLITVRVLATVERHRAPRDAEPPVLEIVRGASRGSCISLAAPRRMSGRSIARGTLWDHSGEVMPFERPPCRARDACSRPALIRGR
ncbi:hypothetical protein GCM10027079_16740 [Sediminivirga luteola]|uniref:Uncharacterized protein n=1 Tax=Sediminivirga luteola TaxID=1774748 RepID=A0A8J2XJV5_9MICO|nr:hypothetical protein GCM10011333_04200 [Sediminivirga luteola]